MRLALPTVAALLLGLALAAATPASAGHRGHTSHGAIFVKGHYGQYNHRGGHNRFRRPHRRRHGHGHHGHGYAVAGVILGSLAIAFLLTRPYPRDDDRPAPARASRVPTPPAGLSNCRPTTGTRPTADGRSILMRGTWCTDAQGRGYILNDSVRFDRYLD